MTLRKDRKVDVAQEEEDSAIEGVVLSETVVSIP
jgi:hypothetical protein